MTKNEHNGWYNYETWLANLWMDNDEGSQSYWAEQAAQALADAKDTPSANFWLTGTEPFTTEERAVLELEKQLKDEFEEANPVGDRADVWADLMNAALSEVNWHEIAKGLIEAAKEATA
jgi:hypothetical protein